MSSTLVTGKATEQAYQYLVGQPCGRCWWMAEFQAHLANVTRFTVVAWPVGRETNNRKM